MQTDAQREELPRIAVDSLRDWERIKNSYTTAAYASLEQRMVAVGRTEADKQKLRGQLERVRAALYM